MRNSDPRVSIVIVHGRDSDLNSTFAVQAAGCNFQDGPNFGIPSDPSCCDNFSIRSPYCCNRRSLLARSSQSKGTCVLITLGTNEENLIALPQRVALFDRGRTIRTKSITCSLFSAIISYCITVGVAARNYFQLQLQPRSLHRIFSDPGYSRGRGTERLEVTITYDSIR